MALSDGFLNETSKPICAFSRQGKLMMLFFNQSLSLFNEGELGKTLEALTATRRLTAIRDNGVEDKASGRERQKMFLCCFINSEERSRRVDVTERQSVGSFLTFSPPQAQK